MTKDTLRAIQRGAGGQEPKLEEVIMKDMLQEVLQFLSNINDNKNRTVSEIRHAFIKYGGILEHREVYLFEAKENYQILIYLMKTL